MGINSAKRCRHGTSWLIMGARLEWCWGCGAIREMRHESTNVVAPVTQWTRPVGPKGENPYPMKRLQSNGQ